MDTNTNTNTNNTGVANQPSTNNNGDNANTVMYTQEQVNAMIQAEADRRVTQALQKQQAKNDKKLEEVKLLATMSAEEQTQYILNQKEQELTQKENRIKLAENKLSCISTLTEKNIPIQLADLVLDVDTKTMNSKITILESVFNTAIQSEVEKRLSGSTPSISTTKIDGMTKEQFRKLSLAEQQKLYTTNKELYESLVK